MTKPLSDEVKAMRKKARKPPKPPDLGKDLVNMMYGFGDSARPDAESVELVERLETLEGERVFPSFWLFHAPGSYDDYRYGDW